MNRLSWIALGALCAPLGYPATGPMLPEPALAAAVEAAPEVAAARARAVEAEQAGRLSALGPYEWELSAEALRRNTATEGRFGEWGTSLTRPFRLPGKAALDRQIGERWNVQADAGLQLVRRAVRVAILEDWYACLRASERRRVLAADLEMLERVVNSVSRRRKAGDLAELDVAIATAEFATQQAEETVAKIESISAARLLATRLEGVSCEVENWAFSDVPGLPGKSAVNAAPVSQHPEVRALEAVADAARLAAERARRDRLPDPTLGVIYRSERAGEERVGGLSLSVPLGGARRSAERSRAAAAATAAEAESEARRLQVQREWLRLDVERRQGFASWRSLLEAETRQQRAAELSRRAFELGETSLTESLLASRAALRARLAARSAAVDAWRADAVLEAELESQQAGSTSGEDKVIVKCYKTIC